MVEFLKRFIPPELFSSGVTIVVAIIVWMIVHRTLSKIIKNRSGGMLANGSLIIVGRIIKYIYILLVLVFLCDINGIKVTSIVAGLGISGAVAVLAAQDLMRDFISGFYIAGERLFSIGDVINYQGDDCLVFDFSFRTTRVKRIKDNSIIYISNRNISDVTLVSDLNFIEVPTPYDADRIKVREVLNDAANSINTQDDVRECVFKDGIQEFGSAAIVYVLLVYCDPVKRGDVLRIARSIIYDSLAESGIDIPYNQMDVRIKQ